MYRALKETSIGSVGLLARSVLTVVDHQARELERVDSHVQDLAGEMEVMRNTVRNQQLLLMKLVCLSEQVGGFILGVVLPRLTHQ